MTPIINPWLFYLADIADKLFWILLLAVGASLMVSVIFLINFAEVKTDENRKMFKRAFMVFLIAVTAFTFIPREDTIYKMMISSQVTEENIQKAEDVIKNSVDYTFEKINEK